MADTDDKPTQTLGSIPFGVLIGGPMSAAIEAQAKAAQTTLGFIEAVAFDDKHEVRTITFKYKTTDGRGKQSDSELVVPILTILPIPYIRIDDMTIAFKASISATTEATDHTSKASEAKVDLAAEAKYLWFKAKLDASYSSKKDSTATKDSKYSVEYTIDINVHAVNEDMPAGLGTVLKMLNESISARPSASPNQG